MNEDSTICLDVPAQYQNLESVRQSIATLLTDFETVAEGRNLIYGIQLAVHEICNNIIAHAYKNEAGNIRITLSLVDSASCFTADLYDSGSPFRSDDVMEPNLTEPQQSGYGLFLARQLMDDVVYNAVPGGNHWHLVKNLPKRGSD